MGAQWKQKWRELAADKKGKVVGKLVREIQVAAKLGGPHPEYNARLAAAVAVAKKQSVTRETIERAIAKGSGTGPDAVQYETTTYEGFTPHRVPVMVELLNYKRDGTPFRNAVMIAPIFDAAGELEWFLGSQVEIAGVADNVPSARAVEAREILCTDAPYNWQSRKVVLKPKVLLRTFRFSILRNASSMSLAKPVCCWTILGTM